MKIRDNLKVAIITVDTLDNYGNRLQNYALQCILQEYAGEVNTLHGMLETENIVKRIAKIFLKKKNGRLYIKGKDNQEEKQNKKRKKQFQNFDEKNLDTILCDRREWFFFRKLNNKFDLFVVGSDQVWKPISWNKSHPKQEFKKYFLSFADPDKRIAYAASFGTRQLPKEWEKPIANELKSFKAISVRENSGAKIVDELTGLKISVVLDPTMMLTAEKWREIETRQFNKNQKYILVYFLGEQPEKVYEEIEYIAKECNADVIHMMDYRCEYYTLGPDGFLAMIDHAYMVFTDSFHGTVFSILFHTPFRVYERTVPNKPSMSTRLETLLEKTRLTECAREMRPPTEEEFARADSLLENERNTSHQFLREAMSAWIRLD